MRPLNRSTIPLVWGDLGGVRRCWMPSSVQSWSNSCSPEGARAREAKSRSVNSFPLAIVAATNGIPMARSVNILAIRVGQAPFRSRENLRALAAVLGMRRLRPIDVSCA